MRVCVKNIDILFLNTNYNGITWWGVHNEWFS